MKNIALFILTIIVCKSGLCLETDNYLVWNRELRDSSDKINFLFYQEINSVLDEVNSSRKNVSCIDLTFKIAKRFKTYPPIKIFIEDWILENLDRDQIFPFSSDYINESIYKNSYGAFLKHIPLSPTIQMNGFYFGIDKLSHFSSTGRRYLKKYLEKLEEGFRDIDAVRSAIDYGILNETTFLGLATIGVYSYGDLEANYQGFLFYKNLCLNSQDSYLGRQQDGKWRVVKYPDIRKYANPFWDETFNLSFRSHKNWVPTSKVIKENYCSLLDSTMVKERFRYYRSVNHRSFSLDYIRELWQKSSSSTPVPEKFQSVEALCK